MDARMTLAMLMIHGAVMVVVVVVAVFITTATRATTISTMAMERCSRWRR